MALLRVERSRETVKDRRAPTKRAFGLISMEPVDAPMLSMKQTITREDRARISLVADAMRRSAAESEIVTALVGSGIPQGDASEYYRLVAHGLKAGVCAGVTDGLSAEEHQRGESPLWDAAFDEGHRQFGKAVGASWLRRLAWLLIPIVAFVIWLLLR